MRVRDLGTLSVAVDGREQPVVGTRGTAVLARLTVEVNQRVSLDALMESVWGERVSAGAASTLESHVWRLRQILEPDRPRRQPPTVLVNDAGGYRLIGGPSSVDSLAFTESIAEVRDLLAAGRAATALKCADSALALWRGRPYGVFSESSWAVAAVARLDELRWRMQERRIEALLALGEIDVALSDLRPLIAEQPYSEPLRGLQMKALYSDGRGEEALQVFRDARRTLVEDVGIEPGPELQDLHHRILGNDASLVPARPSATEEPHAEARAVEVHLPPTLTPLIGRDEVLAGLGDSVGEHRLVTVAGPAGCGKTRLGVEVAHRVARRFPDGVWFVDLAAVSDPDLVVEVISSTIGFASTVGTTALENLRQYLAARRLLLVLDNCEHVLDTVADLVSVTLGGHGAAPECSLLTTSREPLNVAGEVVWRLAPLALPDTEDEAHPSRSPAVELFVERVRAAAPDLRIDDAAVATAVEICVALDGLPLPMELAAARASAYTLEEIADQVLADPSGLAPIGRTPRDHRSTLRAAIEWSHQLLGEDLRRAHRRLSVLPGAFTRDVAASVIGCTPAEADDLVAQLVHRSMVSPDGIRRPGHPTTFRQLVTVRHHAQQALTESGELDGCLADRDRWTTELLEARPPLGTTPEAAWYRRIDDDQATVRATLTRLLSERPGGSGARLARRLGFYWYYRERLTEGARWLELADTVTEGVDPTDAVLCTLARAAVLATQGRIDQARSLTQRALPGLDSSPAERTEEAGEVVLALYLALWRGDAHDAVLDLQRRLDAMAERAGSTNLSVLVDAVRCCTLITMGRIDEGLALAHAVQRRAAAADNHLAGWVSTAPGMVAGLMSANPDIGVPWVERCIQEHAFLGNGAGGMFIENRANFATQAGDFVLAARLYAAARTATRRAAMVWPRRPLTHDLLAVTRDRLGASDFERAWREGERLTARDVLRSAGAG